MKLTLEERTKIFDKVCRLVETKHFNPSMNGVDWNALAKNRRDQILASGEPETFEKEVQSLVAELKTSHTGFRHAGMRNIPARHAINATMQRIAMNGSERWMFQDVHQGGPAYSAGIRPGDLLLRNGEREIRPPDDLTFSVGESASLRIEKLDGGEQTVKVQLPIPKSKTHPVTAPEAVHAERLTDEIGLLKVAMFPGVIGIDVAKDIDRAIESLDGCTRLIVDLRGNTGGGIGGLRLMSYLTLGPPEVGYSLREETPSRRISSGESDPIRVGFHPFPADPHSDLPGQICLRRKIDPLFITPRDSANDDSRSSRALVETGFTPRALARWSQRLRRKTISQRLWERRLPAVYSVAARTASWSHGYFLGYRSPPTQWQDGCWRTMALCRVFY